MTNYELKSVVIEMGLDKVQKKVSWSNYLRYQLGKARAYDKPNKVEELESLTIPYTAEECISLRNFYGQELWEEAERVNNASYHRVARLRNRITDMLLSGNCLFLTLTFTDDVLSKTSKETRRKYVSRFLKQYSNKYVANIDFGKKNDREHYHAVILCDMVDNKMWSYGALNFERVRFNDLNQNATTTRLSKYVSKLTNHAIKNTTKKNYMIYSRGL